MKQGITPVDPSNTIDYFIKYFKDYYREKIYVVIPHPNSPKIIFFNTLPFFYIRFYI